MGGATLPAMWSCPSSLEPLLKGGIVRCHTGEACSSLDAVLHCYVNEHVKTVMCIYCGVDMFCR